MKKHAALLKWEAGELTSKEALVLLSKDMTSLAIRNKSTKLVDQAIAAILGMPEEPLDESKERESLKNYLETRDLSRE